MFLRRHSPSVQPRLIRWLLPVFRMSQNASRLWRKTFRWVRSIRRRLESSRWKERWSRWRVRKSGCRRFFSSSSSYRNISFGGWALAVPAIISPGNMAAWQSTAAIGRKQVGIRHQPITGPTLRTMEQLPQQAQTIIGRLRMKVNIIQSSRWNSVPHEVINF